MERIPAHHHSLTRRPTADTRGDSNSREDSRCAYDQVQSCQWVSLILSAAVGRRSSRMLRLDSRVHQAPRYANRVKRSAQRRELRTLPDLSKTRLHEECRVQRSSTLAQAGRSVSEARDALASFADVTFVIPVPKPRHCGRGTSKEWCGSCPNWRI